MPKVWNLGNTSVRNPNRIELGLRVFADHFQGRIHGAQAEAAFVKKLKEENVLESSNESAWFGRKWRSVLIKMGFATHYDKYGKGRDRFDAKTLAEKVPSLGIEGLKCEITPIGSALLKADSLGAIQDIFLRQLVCYELPSPIDADFSGAKMKPFIFLLQILQGLSNQNEAGLNKREIGIFALEFREQNQELVDSTIRAIITYRLARGKISGLRGKKEFDNEYLKPVASRTGVNVATLGCDYSDTAVRYSLLTGVLAFNGGRLSIRENKRRLVEELLKTQPQFLAASNPFAYLENYYKGIKLPTDNKDVAMDEIKNLKQELAERNVDMTEAPESVVDTDDMLELQKTRYRLHEQVTKHKEIEFARNQSGNEAISEILRYLQAIPNARASRNLEILDRPAFLEWAVWRAFLAINHIVSPISETRGFPLDDDLFPRHNAVGGRADMHFEFEKYVLVVEVTLTTSDRQEACEGIPVRRHVADIGPKYGNKPVYGLFIAPVIDINSFNTFKQGQYFDNDGHEYKLDILPLTIDQFHCLLDAFSKKRYTPKDFEKLLQDCLKFRDGAPRFWESEIQKVVERWLVNLVDSQSAN